MDVGRRQVAQAVLHRLGHRTGCRAVSVGDAGGQVLLEGCVAPVLQPVHRIAGQVVGVPALLHRAGIGVRGVETLRRGARRMALRAMAHRLDEVGATVPVRRPAGIGREAVVGIVDQVPADHHRADIVRERHPVRRRRRMHRGQAEQVGLDGERILARHQRVGVVWHRRIEMLAAAGNARVQHPHELVVGVVADAGLPVGRDVGRVQHAHRQREGAARRRTCRRRRRCGRPGSPPPGSGTRRA